MKPLGLWRFATFVDDHDGLVSSDLPGLRIATSGGHVVRSYKELLKKVAALGYHNPRFKLLFRGQTRDYKLNTRGGPSPHSSLYPTILRAHPGVRRHQALDEAFARLVAAEKLVVERIREPAVHSQQLVRWAVLQHYGVCATPLLDVSGSLQTALSFAAEGTTEGFVFVLAFPQTAGPLSVSLESMTQVIDLSQSCPPEALRPHFQSAMLVGDYPAIVNRETSHGRRGMIGNNFACRLLAKFHLTHCTEWLIEGFTATPQRILFPNDADEWFGILSGISDDISGRHAA